MAGDGGAVPKTVVKDEKSSSGGRLLYEATLPERP